MIRAVTGGQSGAPAFELPEVYELTSDYLLFHLCERFGMHPVRGRDELLAMDPAKLYELLGYDMVRRAEEARWLRLGAIGGVGR